MNDRREFIKNVFQLAGGGLLGMTALSRLGINPLEIESVFGSPTQKAHKKAVANLTSTGGCSGSGVAGESDIGLSDYRSTADTLYCSPEVSTAAGEAGYAHARFHDLGSATAFTITLHDSSGNLITSESGTTGGEGAYQWYNLTVSSPPCLTDATTYYVGVIIGGSGRAQITATGNDAGAYSIAMDDSSPGDFDTGSLTTVSAIKDFVVLWNNTAGDPT